MHRIYLLPLLLLLGLTIVIVTAQENPPPVTPTPLTVVVPDGTEVSAEANAAGSNFFMGLNGSPFLVSAAIGSDFCSTATVLTAVDTGSQMDVGNKTESADDPVLGCMWGSPTNPKGYKTVWYEFTPTANGIMTISTLPASMLATNAYDTVLAVHTGTCGALQTLACNDDTIGFSSTVTMNVRRNVTYYIEVADWQAGGNAIKTLDLALQVEPFVSNWQTINTMPPTLSSRQASVVVGSDLYLIGGRGAGGALLNNFQRFSTTTETWQQPALPSIPGGIMNTTAVYLPAKNGLNPRIYVPGGSISANDSAYSRQHQYFEFTTNGLNTWHTAPKLVGGTIVTQTFAYAAAAVNNAQDGYFLTGGVVGQGFPLTTTATVQNQVLFYRPDTDDWYARAPMTSPRYGHVAANVGGRLCVAGGLNIEATPVLIPNGECASGVGPVTWSPTGNMVVPRYFANSSVSPDGKWYVYGGIDATGKVVPEVEFYNPATNSWSVLGLLYDLGGQDGKPLVWPAGGFVGNYLWMAGGSFDPTGNAPNPQMGKVRILGNNTYLPVVFGSMQFGNNHSFAEAWSIPLNSTISQNFSNTRTLVNVYSFTVAELGLKQVALTNVAPTANVNVYLFNDNKGLMESDDSPFPGATKTITLPLNPGRYYVVVRYLSSNNFPNDLSHAYQIRVNG